MNEIDIVNISKSMFEEANEARKPQEVIWQKVWNLYNNLYDFSKKAEWQSKQYVPKISNSVRAIVGFLKKALVSKDDWFTTKFLDEKLKDYEPVLKHYVYYWLRMNKFDELIDDALIAGLLSNLVIFKIYWKSSPNIEMSNVAVSKDYGVDLKEEKKKKSFSDVIKEAIGIKSQNEAEKEYLSFLSEGVKISVIDPFDFFIDPTGRNKYVIHRTTMDLSDLKAYGKQMGYNVDVINLITEDYRKWEFEYKEAVRKGMSPKVSKPPFRKQVEIWEFWGDLIDSDGNIIEENCTWTIANEKYLLREPIKNPFWHKRYPFVWGPIIKKPFSVYHKNFFEDAIGLATTLTELLNLMIDTNAFATAKAFEVDLDVLVDPEQFKSGIYPGKVFKKRSGGANVPLIREISLGTISPQVLRLYQEVDREFQNATGTTEFLLGKPATRGRPTATEVAIKSQQSSAFIEDIAMNVEDNILSPMLKMIAVLILQYQKSFDDIRFVEIQEIIRTKMLMLAALPEEQKKKMIDIFNFEVRGISGLVSKQSLIEKTLNFISFIAQSPAADYINWNSVIKEISRLLDLRFENFVLPEEVVEKIRQQRVLQDIVLNQLGGKQYAKKNKTTRSVS